MSDRFDRLPKWAKEEIASLKRQRSDALRTIQDLTETVAPTQIWHGDYENRIYIPPKFGYQRVHFETRPGQNIRDDIQVMLDEKAGEVELMGGRSISISPVASNVVRVRFRDE